MELRRIIISFLVALLASSAALAQSSVIIYGTVDVGYGHASSGGLSKNFVNSTGLNASRLGFTGSEDLGNGLKANFKLEAGLNADAGAGATTNRTNQAGGFVTAGRTTPGALVFNRYSYVGLSGSFGEVRLGRDYLSTFAQTQGALDPFVTTGPAESTQLMLKLGLSGKIGAIGDSVVTSASNMAEYITPDFAGFKVISQYFLGENTQGLADSTKSGDGYDMSVHYSKGPINANLGQFKVKAQPVNAATGDYKVTSFSAGYNFRVAQLIYTYAQEKAAAINHLYNKSSQFGVIVPVGALNLKGSYISAKNNANVIGTQTKGAELALGVDYSLSKRTALYATYSHVKNKNGGSWYAPGSGGVNDGTPNNTANAYILGIRHVF